MSGALVVHRRLFDSRTRRRSKDIHDQRIVHTRERTRQLCRDFDEGMPYLIPPPTLQAHCHKQASPSVHSCRQIILRSVIDPYTREGYLLFNGRKDGVRPGCQAVLECWTLDCRSWCTARSMTTMHAGIQIYRSTIVVKAAQVDSIRRHVYRPELDNFYSSTRDLRKEVMVMKLDDLSSQLSVPIVLNVTYGR